MATPRFAWGIDIGNRALKAVRLVREEDRLRVDDFDVIEHEQILSTAGDNKEALIHTALANFVARHEVKGGAFAVGVSGQSSFARFIKLPPVEPKKIPEIIRFEAIQQIPFPLEDVEWSYQLFQNPDSPDVEVGIFAMRKDLVQAVIKNYTDMDMNVQVVQMNPLAVYNAMYYDQRIEGCMMVVDIGAENTDLIIADGETVWLRNIAVGGNAFTEALTKQFKLNFIKAEELKRNAATSKYARQILQTLRPVFDDLVGEIQRSIGFYASGHRDSRIKSIVAMGSTFRLPQLQKYLQNKLQVEVTRVEGLSGGAPADAKQAAMLNESMLSMSAAYGLAIQAFGDAKIESSLLPATIRRAKIWKEKTKWFGAAAAMFVVGTIAAAASLSFQQAQFERQESKTHRDNVIQVLKEAKALDTQWAKVQNSGSDDKQKIENFVSLTYFHDIWPMLLIDFSNAQGLPPPTDPEQILAAQPVRDQRKDIHLTDIYCRYVADLEPYLKLTPSEFVTFAEGQPGAGPSRLETSLVTPSRNAAPKSTQRGYLITIKCNSPNKDGARFIDASFNHYLENLPPLAKVGDEQPMRPYQIARVRTAQSTQIKNDAAMKTKLNAKCMAALTAQQKTEEHGTAAGAGSTMNRFENRGEIVELPLPAATQPSINAYLDERFVPPLAPEDIRNDYEFTVLVAVSLPDPFAANAAEAKPADLKPTKAGAAKGVKK